MLKDLSFRILSFPASAIILLIASVFISLRASPVRALGTSNTLGYYQTARLAPDDLTDGDAFGSALAIDGNTAIIGVPQEDDFGPDSGSAYILAFDQAAQAWQQVAKLTASDAAPSHGFGTSVAILGDTAFVGAPVHPPGGVVYVFERHQGGEDAWGEARQIVGDQVSWVDHFGISMDISGNFLIVGAYAGGSYDGSAYIFQRDQGGPGAWGQVAYLVPADNPAYNYFGFSVAISGDTAAGGAPGYNGVTGAAYIFERQPDDTWLEVTQLTPEDGAFHDFFGIAVDLDGDTFVAGSPAHATEPPASADEQPAQEGSGAVYIFERDLWSPNAWGQGTQLFTSDGAPGDGFGQDVHLEGDLLFAGATGRQEAAGGVYIFERPPAGGDAWSEVMQVMAGDPAPGAGFGNSLEANGLFLLVGAPGAAPGGAAYVFTAYSPPSDLTLAVSSSLLFEGEQETLAGSFSDPDFEEHALVVGWGDGLTSTLTLPAQTQVFTLTHTYLDDLPSGTASDLYTLTVTITDTQGGSAWGDVPVWVENIPPTVFPGADAPLQPGDILQREGSFTDPGADTWTGWVEYGDGSGCIPLDLSSKIFMLEHGYPNEGFYKVTVTVADDDGGQDSRSFMARVSDRPYWLFFPLIQR